MNGTPVPLWSLINMEDYTTMNLQYSRGCPFDCEFCDIVFLNGHKPRTKSNHRFWMNWMHSTMAVGVVRLYSGRQFYRQ